MGSTASGECYNPEKPFKIGHQHLFNRRGRFFQCPCYFVHEGELVSPLFAFWNTSPHSEAVYPSFSRLSSPTVCLSALTLPHLAFPLNTEINYIRVSVNSVALYADTVNLCKYMLCIKLSFLNILKVTPVSYLALRILQA